MFASELTTCMQDIDEVLAELVEMLPAHLLSPSWVNHGDLLGMLWYVRGAYPILVTAGYLRLELAQPLIDQVDELMSFIHNFFYEYVGW